MTVENKTTKTRAAPRKKKPTYKELEQRVRELEIDLAGFKRVDAFLPDVDTIYRTVFEQSRDAIYITTRGGKFIDANPAGVELLGYDRQELMQLHVGTVYANLKDRRAFQKEIEEKGSVQNYSARLRRKDGTILECELTGAVRRAPDGSVRGYQGILRDVTAERQARRELQESEERYRRLFDASPISLWEFDFTRVREYIESLKNKGIKKVRSYLGRHPDAFHHCASLVEIINVNKTTLELCRARSISELRSSLENVFFSTSYEVFREGLIALAEDKARAESEMVMQNLHGEKRNVVLRWFVVPGHEGHTTRVLASFIDITDLKNLERERSNLISMLAHDMKSSLMVIQGFVMRLLNTSLDIDVEHQEKYLDIVKNEAAKLEVLVDDFLEFSRLQTGKLNLTFAPTSLDKELMELYEAYQGAASQKGITLRMKAVDSSPIIEADAHRLRRVFTNLLDNALKFSPNEGTVSIETHDRGGHVYVQIADEGVGIEPEDMAFIFDPFHRGKLTNSHHGYGMGLAAVKAIVEGHGGTVQVSSEPGKGSVFTVSLPKEPR